jgi:hypothetical protein
VEIATGGLEARGLAGDVDVSISAGGVSLSDLRAERVRTSVTTGGVMLDFAEPPREVTAATSVGGVGVVVPDDGTAYDVRTTVSVGEASVGVATDADARNVLDLTTTVGGIDVAYEGSPTQHGGRSTVP